MKRNLFLIALCFSRFLHSFQAQNQVVDKYGQLSVKGNYIMSQYGDTHKQSLRDEAMAAMNKFVALFVSEFGICDASGNGALDLDESKIWFNFLDDIKLAGVTRL